MRSRFGLLALHLLLVCVLFLVSAQCQTVEDIDAYYLDSLGHICTDTVDTVQKVEYDHQIHCTVSPMLVCDEDDAKTLTDVELGRRIGQQPQQSQFFHPSDDLLVQSNDPVHTFQRRPQVKKQTGPKIKGEPKQVCHTMSVKECRTINRPKESKV